MKISPLYVLFLLPAFLFADPAALSRDNLAANPDARVIEGADGWLFLANELRHVAKGTEWVAPETPPEPAHADPLPALIALREQLAEMNIELIIMPVPAKAVVHADALPGYAPSDAAPPPSGMAAFLAHLQDEGFNVINLETIYAETKSEEQVYCKTDSHWSPRGVEIAAKAVADLLKAQDWYETAAQTEIQLAEPTDLRIRGDLAEGGGYTETLPWRQVTRADGEALVSETAPVLILGDSHTLVFGDGGDMHANSGGFSEHLAYQLQQPVDRMANRGSASTPPRLTLFRKAAAQPEWLEGKRAIVYTFTARELTESLNGWRVVPIAPRFR